MHPRSKKWHLIDYIIVRQRDRKDVELTRVMRGAECWTDHRLVRAKLMLSLRNHKRNHHKKVARQNINVELLRDSENIRALNKKLDAAIKENLGHEDSTSIEEEWRVFKEVVLNTSKEVLGTKKRKHRDWFDECNEEINELLNQKRIAFTTMLQNKSPEAKQRYQNLRNRVQTVTRQLKNKRWKDRAMEIQGYGNSGDSRNLYNAIRLVYGPITSGRIHILDSDGKQLLSQSEDILKRWSEYYSLLLNREPSVDKTSIQNLTPQQEDLPIV